MYTPFPGMLKVASSDCRRIARCRVVAVAAAALVTLLAAGAASGFPTRHAAVTSAVPRPPIVWRPIPFALRRKQEMAAYALRHYGRAGWRLVHPQVIVEHYTANESFSATWNTFASDAPDPELHELPGDCAHFVVDSDGTIYQLVSLGTSW